MGGASYIPVSVGNLSLWKISSFASIYSFYKYMFAIIYIPFCCIKIVV